MTYIVLLSVLSDHSGHCSILGKTNPGKMFLPSAETHLITVISCGFALYKAMHDL